MPRGKIAVLIVDDSAFMRKALRRMLSSDPLIKVVGDAKDGPEALAEIKRLSPDVVTLDVKMPGMDGLAVLEAIMREKPTPVLMVSSLTSDGGETTLRALAIGAVDFIDKSSCHTSMDIINISDSLIQKVKIIAGVDLKKITAMNPVPGPAMVLPPPLPFLPREDNPTHLVAIGTSTGGPMALEKVLTALPKDYPGAILVVQHMPVGFTASLAERFNKQCPLEIREAKEDDPIVPGTVYIAPGGCHLKLRRSQENFFVALSKSPHDTMHVPSVDVMMKAVAETWPGRMLGIIMTGMGQDGLEGVRAIKARGGLILAQNEETCVVFGMPRAIFLNGLADRMVPLDDIAQEIIRFR